MSIPNSIKSHKKVFRRSSIDGPIAANPTTATKSKLSIPQLAISQSPRQRSLSIARPELPRPLTSRTILKSLGTTVTPNTTSILPCNPETVIKFLGEYLSEFELTEILDYKEIYYIGKITKIRGKIFDNNWGYDNVKCDYILLIGDHIEFRYEILDLIGKGTFGQVCRCFDHLNKELVAVKIVKNKPKLNQQSMIEVRILKSLNKKDHAHIENIVRLKNFFTFRNHVCMVFELLSINLYEFSKLNKFRQMSFPMLQSFAKQLIRSIRFIHDQNIIHCDLKPENVLLSTSEYTVVKIIDFGSSCFINERIYSYIQSRYYRAPEIILGIPYGNGIDLWSFACILVELYIGYPLFPGESELDLLMKIIEVIGMPPSSIISQAKRKKTFFEDEKNCKEMHRNAGTRGLVEILGTSDLAFVDFIKDILVWDQKIRITAEVVQNHNWMNKSYNNERRRFKESFLKSEVVYNKSYRTNNDKASNAFFRN